MNVHEAVIAASQEIGAIAKTERNAQQGFMFRSIDQVMDRVSDVANTVGLVIYSKSDSITREQYETKNGTVMNSATVHVTYKIVGPDGDEEFTEEYGEGADAGDKSISKAQSNAWKTAMIKLFKIKVSQEDSDGQSHERTTISQPKRVPDVPDRAQAWSELWEASKLVHTGDRDERTKYIIDQTKQHNLDGSKVADLRQLADIWRHEAAARS